MTPPFNTRPTPTKQVILDDAILLKNAYSEPFAREDFLAQIRSSLLRFEEGKYACNLVLYSSKGTGKTAFVQKLLETVEQTSRVQCVYVDCWTHYTAMAVLAQIARKLGLVIPRRGLATDEAFGRISKHLENTGQRVLLVLDRVDGLVFNGQQKLLYDLASAGKDRQLFCTISVCDDAKGFTELDPQIGNALRLSHIEIPRLSETDLKNIMSAKAKRALVAESYDQAVIDACVTRAVDCGFNVSAGLDLLWRSAIQAEFNGTGKITIAEPISADSPETRLGLLEHIIGDLTHEEQIIVQILKNGAVSSTELYSEFKKRMKRSKRQIRNYLNRLEGRRLIRLTPKRDSNLFFKPVFVSLISF